jgi:hypothetical protein
MGDKMDTRRRKFIKLAATSSVAVGGGLSLTGIGATTTDDENEIGVDSAKEDGSHYYDMETGIGVIGSTETDYGHDRIDAGWVIDYDVSCKMTFKPKMYALPIYDSDGAYTVCDIPHRNYAHEGKEADKLMEKALRTALDAMSRGWYSNMLPDEDPETSTSTYYDGFKIEFPEVTVDSSDDKSITGGARFEVKCDTENTTRDFQTYTIIDWVCDRSPHNGGDHQNEGRFGASVSWEHEFK